MKTLISILGIFLVLLMVPAAFAAGEASVGRCVKGCKLLISDVDVKVDAKTDKDLAHGDTVSEDLKPGSKVRFSIKAFNNFTDAEDVKIKDVQATVTIEGIDNGDDFEETSKEVDIKPADDEKLDVEFEIPLEVDEDNYDITILVEGDTSRNGTQEAKMSLSVEVNKEKNEVRILSNSLTPSEIRCARNVQLSTSVINTGTEEQNDATLEVSNDELDIDLKNTFDLGNDPFDEDSKFSKTFKFTVPEDVRAGTYAITSRVVYNNGRAFKTQGADLIVEECQITSEGKEEQPKEKETIDEVVVVQQAQDNQSNLVTAGIVTTPQITTEKESFFQSQTFLIALVVGEVLLVLVAVLLVVAVARRRRE